MSKEIDIVAISVDDWGAAYVNGELIYQDHSVWYEEFLDQLVGCTIRSFKRFYSDELDSQDEPLGLWGYRFPNLLQEVLDEIERIKNEQSKN